MTNQTSDPTEESEGHESTAGALPSPPGSPWEEAIRERIHAHIEGEVSILQPLQELASTDDFIGYLVGLILDDEQRHHRVLLEMENAIRSDIEWRELTPRVPRVSSPGEGVDKTLAQVQLLLENEKRDVKALKRLKRKLGPVKDTTVLALLVETMELDSKKHIQILEFITRMAKTRR